MAVRILNQGERQETLTKTPIMGVNLGILRNGERHPRNRFAAVRFLAAARDAFLARAERSSDVIVTRLRLPPLEPSWAITWLTMSRDTRFAMLRS
jgi:hypothetical protein